MTVFAGVDLSFTSPAITIFDSSKELKFENLQIYNIYQENRKTKTHAGNYGNVIVEEMPLWTSQEQRFDIISDWAIDKIKDCDVLVLEGYSYNSIGAVFDIAENGGVLKNKLYHLGKSFILASPGAQKKCFTGKGNANKQKTVDTFIEKFGVDLSKIIGLSDKYKKPIDDITDSVSLMYYGYINHAN